MWTIFTMPCQCPANCGGTWLVIDGVLMRIVIPIRSDWTVYGALMIPGYGLRN